MEEKQSEMQETINKILAGKITYTELKKEQMDNPEIVIALLDSPYAMMSINSIINQAGENARNNKEVMKKAIEKIEAKRDRYSNWGGELWKMEDNIENPVQPYNIEVLEKQLKNELELQEEKEKREKLRSLEYGKIKFEELPEELKNDYDFVVKALEFDSDIYFKISNKLKNMGSIALRALVNSLMQNKDISEEAVKIVAQSRLYLDIEEDIGRYRNN